MKPIYCAKHGKENNAKPKQKICVCGKSVPTYGLREDPRPSCCKKCKSIEMKDFRHNKCKECDTRASYGIVDGKKEYCATHKKHGMVDLTNKLCEGIGCTSLPVFGNEDKKPIYCKEHKNEGMRNVVDARCEYEGCFSRSFYGLYWQKPQFCVKHKTDIMKNVVTRRCIIDKCDSMPTFGLIEGKATHCSLHKSKEMRDVRHKYCDTEGCTTRPTFGVKEGKPSSCKKHKTKDMIDLVSNICKFEGCQIRANFGEKEQAIYCFTHKKPEMIDVTHLKSRCTGAPGAKGSDGKCPFEQRGTTKYDGMCTSCFPIAFPKDPRAFVIKKNNDEIIVRNYLQTNFPTLEFIHDKPLWTHNCECIHRRRIDLRTIIQGVMLAVEIDEHQHKYKDTQDEEIRYDDLFMIHSGKWIFIRYNPHTFIDDSGKRRNLKKEIRLETLKNTINNIVNNIHKVKDDNLVEIHKLFFDGYNFSL
jgi:EsV-1-7 cysteine-rich motif